MGLLIPVKLIFMDWQKDGKSVYGNKVGSELSMGNFHFGSTFAGGIVVETADQEQELRQALADGYEPVFAVRGSGYTEISGRDLKLVETTDGSPICQD